MTSWVYLIGTLQYQKHYHFEKTNDAVLWLWDAMDTACSLHPGIATDQLPWSTINIDSYCMPMQGISDGQDLRMENGDHGYDYSLDFHHNLLTTKGYISADINIQWHT